MPWKKIEVTEQRWAFVQEAWRAPAGGFAALCRRWELSRQCGYKWIKRLTQRGAEGLRDASRRPRGFGRAWAQACREEMLGLHRRHHGVGARKVRALWRAAHPRRRAPAERTVHRWLQAAGLVRPQRRRPAGPWRTAPRHRLGRGANEVWTLDFKGWFYTGDGTRMQVLTVRDRASRYLLAARHLARPDERSVARCLHRLFRRHGLPKAIRVDRGAPFSSDGPRHWSRLSVGWIRRGLAVQITRRARPQDNGAHEQMHRVLKADTAAPPACTLRAQQQRLDRWRRWYNEQRPHEALGQQPPARHYRASPRRWSAPLEVVTYPAGWLVRSVDRRGYIFWRGQRWQIGRAFYGQPVGLRLRSTHTAVYFGPHLLGLLFAHEHGLRPVRLASFRRSG